MTGSVMHSAVHHHEYLFKTLASASRIEKVNHDFDSQKERHSCDWKLETIQTVHRLSGKTAKAMAYREQCHQPVPERVSAGGRGIRARPHATAATGNSTHRQERL